MTLYWLWGGKKATWGNSLAVVRTVRSHCWAQVQSLVRELKSQKLSGTAPPPPKKKHCLRGLDLWVRLVNCDFHCRMISMSHVLGFLSYLFLQVFLSQLVSFCWKFFNFALFIFIFLAIARHVPSVSSHVADKNISPGSLHLPLDVFCTLFHICICFLGT